MRPAGKIFRTTYIPGLVGSPEILIWVVPSAGRRSSGCAATNPYWSTFADWPDANGAVNMNVPTTRQTHLIEHERVINVVLCKMFINADRSAEQGRNL